MGRCCKTHWVQVVFNKESPEIVHLDQGCNFESTLLKNALQMLGASKTHTIVYHPQEDGMVEQFNCTLLQMLCSYVDTKEDWENTSH